MQSFIRALVFGVFVLSACAHDEPAAPAVAAEPAAPAVADEPAAPAVADEPAAPAVADQPAAPAAVDEPAAAAAADQPAASDAAGALYASCRDRVEGIERDGECTTDADCATAGCSQEVCLAADHAAGLMTTCEVLPCFSVLESCGCSSGRCTWTLGSRPGPAPVPRPGSEGAR